MIAFHLMVASFADDPFEAFCFAKECEQAAKKVIKKFLLGAF